jgi:hypothetical protein
MEAQEEENAESVVSANAAGGDGVHEQWNRLQVRQGGLYNVYARVREVDM